MVFMPLPLLLSAPIIPPIPSNSKRDQNSPLLFLGWYLKQEPLGSAVLFEENCRFLVAFAPLNDNSGFVAPQSTRRFARLAQIPRLRKERLLG